jgi:hypothetical protein
MHIGLVVAGALEVGERRRLFQDGRAARADGFMP